MFPEALYNKWPFHASPIIAGTGENNEAFIMLNVYDPLEPAKSYFSTLFFRLSSTFLAFFLSRNFVINDIQ